MTTLSDTDRNGIRDLLEQAEDDGLSRAQYLDQIAAWLDAEGADEPRRAAALEYATRRADRSTLLAADRTTPGDLDAATALLRGAGERLAAAPWLATVLGSWPAPIAHELARLLDELCGRRGEDRRARAPNPDAALLQLRDAGEALIKTLACFLLRGLIAGGGEGADWARREVFQGRLLLGHWVGLLRESAKRTKTVGAKGPPSQLAVLVARQLSPFADDFVQARNETIGHGARSLDPLDTARLVVGLLEGGRIRRADGSEQTVRTLAQTLERLVAGDAFAGWTLSAVGEGERFDLTGTGAAESWLAAPCHAEHQGRTLPLELHLPDGSRLSLAPLMAARICSQCGRRDVVLYDSLYDAHRGGRFDLMDYARGHKSRLWGSEATDLAEAIQGLVPEDAPDLPGESLALGRVLLALDRARVDRNYLSPEYLRADFAAFLAERPGGIYWLQAPAHIGKTTFVQGLAGDTDLSDEPIDLRFAADGAGRIVAYYCRKEYRTGVSGLVNRLSDRLQGVYDPSDTRRNEQPDLLSRRERSPTPGQFIDWLQEWRLFGAALHHGEPGPLIVCIDGLDESEPPDAEGRWPLQILPDDESVPDGIYLLLTSRPPDAEDAPPFLRQRVTALYGNEAREVTASEGPDSAQ